MLLRIMYLLLRPNEIFVFSRLFMEFGTSQFQFTLIKLKKEKHSTKKQHKSVHAFRNLFRKV